MTKYIVPVTWLMTAEVEVWAENEDQAAKQADLLPLPIGEYVPDSFEVIFEEIQKA